MKKCAEPGGLLRRFRERVGGGFVSGCRALDVVITWGYSELACTSARCSITIFCIFFFFFFFFS